jgi:putative ABC transport system substrate-binding protein
MTALSRRQFVQGVGVARLGLLAGCGPLPFGAKPPPRVHRIGFWAGANPVAGEAFRQGLREHGYVEGDNLAIEFRPADDRIDLFPDIAAELVRLQVDVIVTGGIGRTRAARNATSTIPIVEASGVGDLVESGLAASLARPGGNVTGLTLSSPEIAGKRVELLTEAVPGSSRVAALWNAPQGAARCPRLIAPEQY